ncbi:hypothetical protein E2C01_020794 [Portunus trituberculatus]|uniref:Uncharacterized protein n=1 Tax=Portunus trituberculatus TaxID=210409 RepID=A0A5B7E0W3_PORTR|nr:hypothetical protein [Portunus trituberculatus]
MGRPKKRLRECVTGYESVENKRTYGKRSPVVESSHRSCQLRPK